MESKISKEEINYSLFILSTREFEKLFDSIVKIKAGTKEGTGFFFQFFLDGKLFKSVVSRENVISKNFRISPEKTSFNN